MTSSYRPSLVNRTIDAVEHSRWSPALVYGLLMAAPLAVEGALLTADGTWPEHLEVIHVMLPVFAVMTLPSVYYRNRLAERSLTATRSLMRDDEAAYADLQRRLTVLPAGRTFVAGMVGLAMLAVLMLGRPDGADRALGLYTSPTVTVLQGVFQLLLWAGVGVTGYHILRQAHAIHDAYTRQARIDLFTPGPLYALSRIAAANTLFTIAVGAVGALAVAPGVDPADSPTTPAQWAVFVIIVLTVVGASFVAPLYGAHRLLAAEKARALDQLGSRTEIVIGVLGDRVDAGTISEAADVQATLEGLVTARAAIDRIRTWPWEADTARAVVTGLVAPVVIYFLTQAVDAWM